MLTNEKKNIVFYDGECNLCHWAVRFVNKFDKSNKILCLPLKSFSEYGQHSISEESIILLQNNKPYYYSDAVLKIFFLLGGLWRLTCAFWIIPKFIRDGLYKLIANNRYKWFGKLNSCELRPEKK